MVPQSATALQSAEAHRSVDDFCGGTGLAAADNGNEGRGGNSNNGDDNDGDDGRDGDLSSLSSPLCSYSSAVMVTMMATTRATATGTDTSEK